MENLSRRSFLSGSSATLGMTVFPTLAAGPVNAQVGLNRLQVTTRTLDIGGRAATVKGILDGSGKPGLVLDPGERFLVDLTNELQEETIVHWHGQIPPNVMDGVSNTAAMIASGTSRKFDFSPRPGTYWMHSHVPAQEIDLLAAPLIVRSEEDAASDRQEVVMFLHDFSFRSGEEILAEFTLGAAMDHGEVQAGSRLDETPRRIIGSHSSDPMQMTGMAGMDHGGMSMPEMDLNDFEFDAYLANERTLDDPEVVRVDRSGRVLLRIINASSMTAFWIDLGDVQGELKAVDGDPVEPMIGTRFGLAMGQRLDVEITMPDSGTAVPVLALREGARERTGLILAPSGANVSKIASTSDSKHSAFSGDVAMETALRAKFPLPIKEANRTHMIMLGGAMSPYSWTINGQVWGNHTPIAVLQGERVEMIFHNMSMMAHPMHLHGHVFQVVEINGKRIAGAVRDTVHVPAMGMVTIAFDAGEVAPWMLHCHHMAHMATGMMTELDVRMS